jgi:hypothetical protein
VFCSPDFLATNGDLGPLWGNFGGERVIGLRGESSFFGVDGLKVKLGVAERFDPIEARVADASWIRTESYASRSLRCFKRSLKNDAELREELLRVVD